MLPAQSPSPPSKSFSVQSPTVHEPEMKVETTHIELSELVGSTQQPFDEEREAAKKRKYKKMFVIRLLIRLTVIVSMIILIIKLKLNINDWLQWILDFVYKEFGSIWSPILFCAIFSFWTSISPMGYLPTVLCGIFFKWYIAPFVAYISINIGSLINILIIRYIILRNKDKCCIAGILRCCCGKKFGQVSFLKRLFIATSNPIKIIILLRLPYLNNGVINYLFSLQVDSLSIKQNIIGNLIGFIPGSIIFSIFGQEIKSIAKIISNKGFESTQQMVLTITIAITTIICYILIFWKVKSLIKSGTKSQKKDTIINDTDYDGDYDHNHIADEHKNDQYLD